MKFKKFIALFLALIMALSCAACDISSVLSDVDSEQVLSIVDYFLGYSGEAEAEPVRTRSTATPKPTAKAEEKADEAELDEDGTYTSKEDVALYIYTYGKLPSNFVTKAEAKESGWPGGGLEEYLPGKCIGGDRFGNREGVLPDKRGRKWTECDINTLGARSRGAERIVFSNDGLIYYTADHYESFELLYDSTQK